MKAALKAMVTLACLTLSMAANASRNSQAPNECLQNPTNPDCRRQEEAFDMRIDQKELIEMCRMQPTLPQCRALKTNRAVLVKLSPRDYQQLQDLRNRRLSVLKDENQFLAELNFLIIQERVNNERLFQSTLRYSSLDSKKFSKLIQKIRVAVETQQQLDDRFGTGTGGLRLSFETREQMGDSSSTSRDQMGDGGVKSREQMGDGHPTQPPPTIERTETLGPT